MAFNGVVNELLDHDYVPRNMVFNDIDEQLDYDDIQNQLPYIQHQRAETFTVLPGIRLNSMVFMDNLNYRYYKNGTRNNKTYLVCENQKNVAVHCPSTTWVISTEIKNGNGIITTRLPHNHLPPNVDISMVHLRRSIGVAGTSTGNLATSIRQIYNREVVLNREGAQNYTHLQSRLCVNKMRRRRRPNNPLTINELAVILNELATSNHNLYFHLTASIFKIFQHYNQLMVDGERVGVVYVYMTMDEKNKESPEMELGENYTNANPKGPPPEDFPWSHFASLAMDNLINQWAVKPVVT